MIEISEDAASEIQKIVKENGDDGEKTVRIYVAGHG